jgi:ABC-type dipeptide/oligopeptide/nickel transport system ATPase component
MARLPTEGEGEREGAGPVLDVRDLRVTFCDVDGRGFPAVRGVSFSLRRGETLALVGESGSGKSVTSLALARLLPPPPSALVTGQVLLGGQDVLAMDREALRRVRGGRIAYVFQDPATSLNPVFSIRSQIGEAIRTHRPEVADRDAETVRWLDRVGIPQAASRLHAYPHELSGGMQQRVMIAMALACRPDVLVADEPTTALDVTVQRKILELLGDLQREFEMAVLLVTHNFAIVRDLAHRVAVLFRGEVVEQGPTATVLGAPQHPYTRALIECIPRLGQRRERLATIDYAAIEGGGGGDAGR